MTREVPNKFTDPFWSDLSARMEQKHRLPQGLLRAIVLHGERSNNDQVSSAQARTPFQIIPQTRKAFLDKYGVDAYLSPENAAEVGALHLRESLDRHGGNVAAAISEYNTSPAIVRTALQKARAEGDESRFVNYLLPETKAYTPRVLSGLRQITGQAPARGGLMTDSGDRVTQPVNVSRETRQPPVTQGQSTFERALAAQPKPEPSAQLAQIHAAYKSGQMAPEDAAAYEEDVRKGVIMLPRGEALRSAAPNSAATAATPPQASQNSGAGVDLPPGVIEAYQSGKMSRDEKIALEQDAASGLVKLPAGVTLGKTEPLTFMGSEMLGKAREAITGTDRETETTRTLPDWTGMPELNSASMASFKAGLGTMFAPTPEAMKVIQAQFPGVQVRQDERGNPVLKSSIDGKEYAVKPGFRVGDIPRAIGGVAAFTPAGRATSIVGAAGASAGTQAAIEATQAATGGEFNPGDVAIAGGVGAAIPAIVRGVQAVRTPAQQLRQEATAGAQAAQAAPDAPIATGTPSAAPRASQAAPEAPAPSPTLAQAPPVRPTAPVQAQAGGDTLDNLTETARRAAQGDARAEAQLAQAAAPDQKTVEAARRLGIEDHLQADHVSTNAAFRDLSQALKSLPGSQARAAELQGYEAIAKRADDIIERVGGTTDVSTFSAGVKSELQAAHDGLRAAASKLYDDIRTALEKTATPAPAPNTLALIRDRARTLGGEQHLSAGERQAIAALTPKGGKEPTYALLDQIRKDIGAAKRGMNDAFGSADKKLLGDLETALRADQKAVAQTHGLADKFEAAQNMARMYKGYQDDLTALFGKELDKSLVGELTGAVKALPSGDVARFTRFLSSLPKGMRQDAVATGLNTAFGKNARNGNLDFTSYANWYDGLLRNKQAYHAVMSNLPSESRKQLSDLYRISAGIRESKAAKVPTGRVLAAVDAQADGFVGKIYGLAKKTGAAEAASTSVGLPGAGISGVIASALTKNSAKNAASKAADELIASPQFAEAVKQHAKPEARRAAVRRLAFSRQFTRYARAVGNPREMSNKEQWILKSMQANQSTTQPGTSK